MALKPSGPCSALPKLVPTHKAFSDPALKDEDGAQPRVRMAGPDAEPAEIRGWVDLGDFVAIATGGADSARQCINRHFRASKYQFCVVNVDDLLDSETRSKEPGLTRVAFVKWDGDFSDYRRLVANTSAKEFVVQHVKTDRGKALAKEAMEAHSIFEAAAMPAGSFAQRAALTGAEDSVLAAQAVPLLGTAAPTDVANNSHHIVSSRGDVNINVGAPAAASSPAAQLVTSNHSNEVELKPLPMTGLASEVESVRDIAGISDETKNALIESRVGAVLAVNNMIKSVATSNANRAKYEEDKVQYEAEEVLARKRHQDEMADMDKRHTEERHMQKRRHTGVMDELAQLGESATLLRDNGAMTPIASRALAQRVLSSAELAAEVQASDDHVLQGVVHQAAGFRTAKEHQELRMGVPVPKAKLTGLRRGVLNAYKATMGAPPQGAWKKREPSSGRAVIEVDAFPTGWLDA